MLRRSWRSSLSVALVAPAAAKEKKPAPSTTTTTTTWPPLPAFDPTLAWSDCGDGFQCATLNVPVDWRSPPARARTATGADGHRAHAPCPPPRRTNASDRWCSTTAVRARRASTTCAPTYGRLPQTVRDRFDVVTFDPRGTGASRPVDCVDDAFLDQGAALAAFPTTTEQLDALHAYNAQFAAGCVQRMGAYAGQVGTRNVARDMEAIRIALGDPKLELRRVLVRCCARRGVRADVPGVGRAPGARRPTRLLDQLARLRLPPGQGLHGGAERLPRLVPAERVLARGVGQPRAIVLTQLIARVDQQPMDASYVTQRRHARRRADTGACSRTRCCRCSTTAHAGGRCWPTR